MLKNMAKFLGQRDKTYCYLTDFVDEEKIKRSKKISRKRKTLISRL